MINNLEIITLGRKFLKTKLTKKNQYSEKFIYYKNNKTLERIFDLEGDNLFEKVILADKNKLEFYIEKYIKYLTDNGFQLKSIETLSTENKRNKVFKELLALHNTYPNFSTEWNKEIVNTVNTRTCMYCNREYIINFSDNCISKTTAELDHFYPRSLFPFLSISFFNLIPSCKICNSKLKGDYNTYEKKILYPYVENLKDNIDFNLKIDKCDFINDKNSFHIELKPKNKKALNSKKLFKLEILYQEHKDIVLELIQKREIYPDSYIDNLFQQYEGTLFKNREDVLRHITGGYIEDKDINKRPLSKLIKDISEELDLI